MCLTFTRLLCNKKRRPFQSFSCTGLSWTTVVNEKLLNKAENLHSEMATPDMVWDGQQTILKNLATSTSPIKIDLTTTLKLTFTKNSSIGIFSKFARSFSCYFSYLVSTALQQKPLKPLKLYSKSGYFIKKNPLKPLKTPIFVSSHK